MKKDLISKSDAFSKKAYDKDIRNSFFKQRKLYSKICKKKRKEFIKTNKLDNLIAEDPQAYWKLVNDIKEDISSKDHEPNISMDTWVEYFKQLFSVKAEFTRQNEYFSNLLNKLSKVNQNNECPLNSSITDKEILHAVKDMKNNKTCGLDGIKNEMLKTSITHILPCLNKLFNYILSSGHYPAEWKLGYITPIYKMENQMTPLTIEVYQSFPV